jgi:hypothetical protein
MQMPSAGTIVGLVALLLLFPVFWSGPFLHASAKFKASSQHEEGLRQSSIFF